jgi:Protein of unknown function (DUF4232)
MMIANASRFLLVGVIACLVAACGLQKAPHSGGHADGAGQHGSGGGHAGGSGRHASPPARTGSPKPVAAACTIADITVRLDTGSAGVAAGTSYLPLDFTNDGSSSCLLAGFPEVTFADSESGRQIGAAATLDRSASAQTLTLAAGQTAHIWLRLVDVANLPTAKCRPVQAAGLRVGLPGQSRLTFVAHPLMACGRTVAGTDVLTVEPFRAGIAKPGTAQ